MADKRHAVPIIRTKLHRPPVPADYVHRSRMLSHLERRCNRPLTLVSAPAGYGKSVLIRCWLESCHTPGAWLSLDENDNDLARFVTYVVAALQTAVPDVGEPVLEMLPSPRPPSVDALMTALINERSLPLPSRLIRHLSELINFATLAKLAGKNCH